jgi:hypothetical protein
MGLTGYYRAFIRHPLTDRIAQERGAISVDVWRRHGILHPARLCTTHCGGDRFLSDWRWYGSNAAQSSGIFLSKSLCDKNQALSTYEKECMGDSPCCGQVAPIFATPGVHNLIWLEEFTPPEWTTTHCRNSTQGFREINGLERQKSIKERGEKCSGWFFV